MKITLYSNHYSDANSDRQVEIDECLIRNINNPLIDRIVILGQSGSKDRFASSKVVWIERGFNDKLHGRPTFRDYFDLVNRCVESPDDVSIVANSDMYYDDSLAMLKTVDLEGAGIALTRWEVRDHGCRIETGDHSQDTWIFQGRIRPLGWVDFPLGIYGCDNRLAWELRHADYVLFNPCFDLRSYHVHGSDVRNSTGDRINGPADVVMRCKWNDCHFRPKRITSTGMIAYSLWGFDPESNIGAIANARIARHIYPGWIVRFYVDDTVPYETLAALRELKTEVVKMPPGEGRNGSFWRFLVADERSVARWMVRCTHCRLNYRERRAVDDWIQSGRAFHAMHDHPKHTNSIEGFGFGGLRGSIDDMTGKIAAWTRERASDSDESFLAEIIWKSVVHNAIVHSSVADKFDETVRPFPTEREFGRFVGERCRYDEHWEHGVRELIWNADGQRSY